MKIPSKIVCDLCGQEIPREAMRYRIRKCKLAKDEFEGCIYNLFNFVDVCDTCWGVIKTITNGKLEENNEI